MIEKIECVIDSLERELQSIILYWTDNTLDNVNGGFIGQVDYENKPNLYAEKGIILNTRILWTFSAIYNFWNDKKYLEYSHKAYEYLIKNFIDYSYGGVFWLLDFKGVPIIKRKQIYAQAFAIYALCEYFKATGNKESLEHAIKIYQLIEKYAKDKFYGGYIEAFNENWSKIDDYRLSEKDLNTPKSMNTHLHLLEAYTNLYNITKDDNIKINIIELINIFTNKIFNNKILHLDLFFENDWKKVSNIISYGHDIETSWLIVEAARIINEPSFLNEIKNFSLILANSVLSAIDKYGGIIYEYNYRKNSIDTDKHWWPQAEALVGFLNAYEISGNELWLNRFYNLWNYICQYVVDKKYGEWHWRVNQENIPYKENKVDFWKCPYHNTRALIESINRLKKIKDYE